MDGRVVITTGREHAKLGTGTHATTKGRDSHYLLTRDEGIEYYYGHAKGRQLAKVTKMHRTCD